MKAYGLIVLGLLAGAGPTDAEPQPHIPRLRTADPRIRALIDEGRRTSPTFRALAARIERSDVVVYVQCEAPSSRLGGGRLVFVSSAGGFRYVVVRMGWLPSRRQQIAMLAHELQHAVEIADTPAIVDSESLAREYTRMADAKEVTRAGAATTAFDTHAANVAGSRVLRALTSAKDD
jgi:hypothetical protein